MIKRVFLAISLSAILLAPRTAWSSPSQRQPADIKSVGGGDTDQVRVKLKLRGLNIKTGAAVTIEIETHQIENGHTFKSRILSAEGDVLGESDPEVCIGCTEDKLSGAIASQVAHLRDFIPVSPPPPRQTTPSQAVPKSSPTTASRPRRGLFAAGLTLAPLGAAMLGAGAAQWALGTVRSSTSALITHTNYRPAGIALSMSGLAVFATGITLAILSQRPKRSKR